MRKEKVLIAGGSGLVGSFLSNYLDDHGYEVHILSRKNNHESKFKHWIWNLKTGEIDPEALQVEHIINLTGAGIVDKPWTSERKKILISSRVDSTLLILEGLKKIKHRPKSYLSASATGIYGDRGVEELTESSQDGADSFMVTCCQKWEAAAVQLKEQCDKLTILRIGLVLSMKGGVLKKFVLPIKLAQANYFGSGTYYYSWIHIEDLSNLFLTSIQSPDYKGILNAVGPEPIQAKGFMTALKNVLAPYALVFPLPRFVIKLILGTRAVAVTNSTRVVPEKALGLGFKYKFGNLEAAVADLVKRKI